MSKGEQSPVITLFGPQATRGRGRHCSAFYRFFAVLLIVLTGAGQVAGGRAHAATAQASLIALTLDGDVYVIRADGTDSRRLTHYGMNSDPVLSPDQRLIAYRSVPQGYPATHNIWLIGADGSGAVKLTATDPSVDRGVPTWSPDGRRLAFVQGHDVVVVDMVTSSAHTVLNGIRVPPYASLHLAWSPDGRRLAAATNATTRSAGEDGGPVADLATIAITISSLHGGTPRTVFSTLPPLLPAKYGIFVDGDGLSWTPDGRSFLFVSGNEGAPDGPISGIWQASDAGGTSRLSVGTMAYLKEQSYRPKSSVPPLYLATQFQLSPDGRYMATDAQGYRPATHLWLAPVGTAMGRFLDRTTGTCVEYAWLADSSGFACLTIERDPGTRTPWTFTSSLWRIPLDGSAPGLLLRRAHTSPHSIGLRYNSRTDSSAELCTGPCFA